MIAYALRGALHMNKKKPGWNSGWDSLLHSNHLDKGMNSFLPLTCYETNRLSTFGLKPIYTMNICEWKKNREGNEKSFRYRFQEQP